MSKPLAGILAAFLVSLTFLPALAQRTTDEDAAACAACGGLVMVLAVIFIINIAILVWVARDAKARGMASPVGWLILIFFTGVLGLIVFILSRPKGPLARCPHCGNKRLQAMARCPHCGN